MNIWEYGSQPYGGCISLKLGDTCQSVLTAHGTVCSLRCSSTPRHSVPRVYNKIWLMTCAQATGASIPMALDANAGHRHQHRPWVQKGNESRCGPGCSSGPRWQCRPHLAACSSLPLCLQFHFPPQCTDHSTFLQFLHHIPDHHRSTHQPRA